MTCCAFYRHQRFVRTSTAKFVLKAGGSCIVQQNAQFGGINEQRFGKVSRMKRVGQAEGQYVLPWGTRFVDALAEQMPVGEVRSLATSPEAVAILGEVERVMAERAYPGFLHSALCAMSLPVKCPEDEMAPIVRQDGNYMLVIQPIERHRPKADGGFETVNLGVPYGVHARMILLFIMSEAVKTRSREIFLGKSFSEWLRRMGITNVGSGGKRGTRSLVQEQVDRLMNCQWTIRWDSDLASLADGNRPKKRSSKEKRQDASKTLKAFAVNDMKIVNQYGGISGEGGDFVSHFTLSEAFYTNLIQHAVPMNERAFAALRRSATKIDLYTYLSFRLPRIPIGEEVRLSWNDLAKHLGNETAAMFKFRQTVRGAWESVSGVYQQARHSVDLSDLRVVLRHAEPPTEGHLMRVKSGRVEASSAWGRSEPQLSLPVPDRTPAVPALPQSAIRFPSNDYLEFSSPALHKLGVQHGSGNAVNIMAAAFRKLLGAGLEGLEGDRLTTRWAKFCQSFKPPR